jgi:hypothetical protein
MSVMMTLGWVEYWKFYRSPAFTARKDGTLNESGSILGNADVNLVQLPVPLPVLVAINSWKMAIKNSANCLANSLDLVVLPIRHYPCKTQIWLQLQAPNPCTLPPLVNDAERAITMICKSRCDVILAVQVDCRLEVSMLAQP